MAFMPQHKPHQKPIGKRLVLTAFLAVMVALGAVYVINGPKGNKQTAAPKPARTVGLGRSAYSTGHMSTFLVKHPALLPDIEFFDAAGKTKTFADWRGKVVLVNLWATWCGPCRREMPALAALDKAFEGKDFDVVAVSIDKKGIEASGKFLAEIKAQSLGLFVDPSGKIARDFKSYGLPASILLDRNGREIGRLVGPAEWNSDDARRLIQAALDGKLKPLGKR
jgi:thiol-disulfide isomerase/thioredoxin